MSVDTNPFIMFAENRPLSLARLRAIAPEWTETPLRRTTDLLWDFEAGEARGWAFRAGRWYRDALDIRYTPRSVSGKVTHEWTQGSAFDFKVGYTTESRGWMLDLGVEAGPATIQVLEARPAKPADVTIHRWKQRPPDGETADIIAQAEESGARWAWRTANGQPEPYRLHVMSRRTPGVVRLEVLIWLPAGWRIVGQLTMAQDDLVMAIIAGLSDAHVAELKERNNARAA